MRRRPPARTGRRPALACDEMSVKAEAKPLTAPLPGAGSPGTTVTVEPLVGGEVQFPRALLERRGDRLRTLRALGIGTPRRRWQWLPVPAFLIRHPSAGPLLVDTALHPSVVARPAANLGRTLARFTRARVRPGEDLSTKLRERDVDPRSVSTVLLTHLHFDHSSGISEFPNATFVLAEREWRTATTERRPLLQGYVQAHYDYLFDYRTVDFDRPEISSYGSFGRTFDVFGDGSVRLAFTPGHSAGHCSVIARLRERDFVIAGDAVYESAQIEGAPMPSRPFDEHNWKRSVRELRQFARTYPDAVIVPSHDIEVIAGLDARYE
jgi:N-acyl homoserine lactone hydrolase